jgi:hypothetical protein
MSWRRAIGRLGLAAAGACIAQVALAGPAASGPATSMASKPPCRLVVGGGDRRTAGDDSMQADFWNRLNFSFYDAAQYALSDGPREAVGMFLLVGAKEPAQAADDVLAKAEAAGCSEVVRLSVFGDDTADPVELVFRITASPVERGAAGGAHGGRLGAPTYQHEYRFASTEDVERTIVTSDVGEKAVAGYLEAVAAARPSSSSPK